MDTNKTRNVIQQAMGNTPLSLEEQLLKLQQGSLQQQRDAIAASEKRLSEMPEAPDKKYQAIVALSDMFNEQKLMPAYQAIVGDPAAERKALEEQLRKQRSGLTDDEIQLLKMQMYAQNQQGKAKTQAMSPFQKKRDEAFAKEASDWLNNSASFAGNLDRLKAASERLNLDDELGDRMMPKGFRQLTGDDEAVAIQEQIEFVAQQSLKQILGGQFSEKEAKQLIERTYNPTLPDKDNVKKLNKLIQQLEKAAEIKNAAIRWVEENGTLSGFRGGELTSLGQLEKQLKDDVNNFDTGDKDSPKKEYTGKAKSLAEEFGF